jgi:putative membrane protein insertion efficiency factor
VSEPSSPRAGLILNRIALRLISTYQEKVGPRLRPDCHFEPSCSQYGQLAFTKYGSLRATAVTLRRIVRCTFAHGARRPDPL